MEDALDVLNNPTEEEAETTRKFVAAMVGKAETADEAAVVGKANSEELVIRVHDATANKESFVKAYVLKDMPLIPGTKTQSTSRKKSSKIDNFRAAISEFPYLFEFHFSRQGFNRLVLEADRFNQLLIQHGP